MQNRQVNKKIPNNSRYGLEVRLVKLLNVIMVLLPFMTGWFLYYMKHVCGNPTWIRHTGMMLIYSVLYCIFGNIYNAFLVSIKRIPELILGQTLAVSMANGFVYIFMVLICGELPNPLPGIMVMAVQLLMIVLWCRYACVWFFSRFERIKTGIIYDARRGMEGLFGEYGLDRKFNICFTCTVEQCFEQNMQMMEGMQAVFLSGVHSRERNAIVKYCMFNDIDAYIIPRIGDVILSGAQKMYMFHLPFLRVKRYTPSFEFVCIKRLFDIVSSLMVIIVTSPLMLATAIAIKANDGGPVFYKQTRLTKDGKPFQMLKFRSMRVDAEKDGVARLSTGIGDDRITPVGHYIRKTRIDELPQLFNILGGSMSVVGPRPERPEIAAQYEKEIPEFALRLQAKAGLTGYAQVYGKYNTMPYDKLQMDLMYIANPSILEDLKIIFATIQVLFLKESTEGVQASQVTALKNEEKAAEGNGKSA